ncbi:hypothetical protein CRI77_02145 [Mycolicibacterium duvalii]|nr:hypothetical protein CRI77_02145 [Mycolicibacterium duvalii]
MFLRIGDARLAGRAQCPRRTTEVCSQNSAAPRPHRPDLALAGRECQLHS